MDKHYLEYISPEKKIGNLTRFLSGIAGEAIVFCQHGSESSVPVPGLYASANGDKLRLSLKEGSFTGPNNEKTKALFTIIESTTNLLTRSLGQKLFKDGETKQSFSFLGMMMRGLAHEINNPLGILASYIQYLQLIEEDAEKSEILLNMLSSVFRASDTVKSISGFGRSSAKKDILRISGEITEAINFFEQIRKYRFPDIRIEIGDLEDFAIFVNKQEFQEILLSLLLNSCEAYEGKGSIQIETNGYSDVFCRMTVSDQGGGISSGDLTLVTTPFFTTKGKNEGKGLGLTICEYLIRRNGGEIVISSEEGKGTEVQIYYLRIEDENTNS